MDKKNKYQNLFLKDVLQPQIGRFLQTISPDEIYRCKSLSVDNE